MAIVQEKIAEAAGADLLMPQRGAQLEEMERSRDADSLQNNSGELSARHDATTLARTWCNPVAPSGT